MVEVHLHQIDVVECGYVKLSIPEMINANSNQIICGDCIDKLNHISENSVDLIYTDPPFYTNKNYIGTTGKFSDIWKSLQEYLDFMKIRLTKIHHVLKPTGSLYLHCDPTASHYLKIVLDAIFGKEYFRREIIWNVAALSGYKTRANNWIRGHDVLFYYTKSKNFTFNKQVTPHNQKYIDRFNKIDEDGRKYFDGRGKPRYLDEAIKKGKAIGDVWSDIMSFQQTPTSKEIIGYPTQKPLALLERIIKASSNKDDIILDPFCGSGTTLVAAKKLDRNYIGIDKSKEACAVSTQRIDDMP